MVEVVQKHFPELKETMKGHGRKTKSGLRSTKVLVNEEGEPVEKGDSDKTKQKQIFMKLVTMEEELHNKIFTDQTGAFPHRSSKGT